MATSYSPKIVTEGLIMCVDFTNPKSYISGSSSASDLSLVTTTGSITAQPSRVEGNGAVHTNRAFRMNIGTNHIGLTSATCIMWVKPNAHSTGSRFWGTTESTGSNVYGYQTIGVDNTGVFYASQGATITYDTRIVTGSIVVTDDRWHMMTFQYAVGDKLYLFTDNTKTVGISFPAKGNQGNISRIGTDYNANQQFSGSIAGVLWYNRVLTDTEVFQNFNATRGRFGV